MILNGFGMTVSVKFDDELHQGVNLRVDVYVVNPTHSSLPLKIDFFFIGVISG